MIKKFPIHPILFAIYPILFLYTNNISMLEMKHIYMPILWSVAGTLILWALLNLFIKNKFKSAVIISIVVVLFFSYGHVYEIIQGFTEKTLNLSSDIYLSINYLLILVISSILILRSHKKFESTSFYFSVTSFILIIFPIYTLISFSSVSNNNQSLVSSTDLYDSELDFLNPPENKPDIYYIILDGYARGDVLNSLYEFDNYEFYQELEKREFLILDSSLSNYCQTSLSLASSLNMNYIDSLIQGINPLSEDRSPIHNLIADNKVAKLLQANGYKYITFSSGLFGLEFTEIKKPDLHISSKKNINEIENLLDKTTLLKFINKLLLKRSPLSIHRDNLLFTLSEIANVDIEYSPKFIIAHILAPHPPFVLGLNDDDENLNARLDFGDGSMYHGMIEELQVDYKKKYLQQLKALNVNIIEMTDKILTKNQTREILIVLQADHGPRSLLNWENSTKQSSDETFPIFNAIYLPERIKVKPDEDITPVNTFRFLFNQLFNTNFKILPNKSYFSKWSRPYDFIEVEVE